MKKWWRTSEFWKEMKKQDRFLEKLNRAIDRKHWKDFLKLVEPKSQKDDWL